MFGIGRSLLVASLILTSSFARADQIRMYTSGEKSLAARLKAISAAKNSIDIVTFEFKPCDASTKVLIGLLVKKAADGVAVRIMLDDFPLSDAEKKGLAGYFASKNIEFKIYNQWGLNHRNHIKLTLIDGAGGNSAYFADSSNYSDQYFGMSSNVNYVNRDFKITGGSVAQAAAAFKMLWNSSASGRVKKGGDSSSFFTKCLQQNKRDVAVTKYLSDNLETLSASGGGYTCGNVKYVADDPRFLSQGLSNTNDRDNRNEEYMNDLRLKKKLATASFLSFLDGTGRILNVENQYYIPVHRMRRLFEDMRDERGINILVLTNLTTAGNGPGVTRSLGYHITRSARRDSDAEMAVLTIPSRGRLAKRNPMTPKNGGGSWHLHSKSMVRDHKDVWMGSYNIDPRSYHTNLEYAVTVQGCPKLAAAIERDYKRMLEAYEADLKDCKSCRGEAKNLNPFQVIGAFFSQNFL